MFFYTSVEYHSRRRMKRGRGRGQFDGLCTEFPRIGLEESAV